MVPAEVKPQRRPRPAPEGGQDAAQLRFAGRAGVDFNSHQAMDSKVAPVDASEAPVAALDCRDIYGRLNRATAGVN